VVTNVDDKHRLRGLSPKAQLALWHEQASALSPTTHPWTVTFDGLLIHRAQTQALAICFCFGEGSDLLTIKSPSQMVKRYNPKVKITGPTTQR